VIADTFLRIIHVLIGNLDKILVCMEDEGAPIDDEHTHADLMDDDMAAIIVVGLIIVAVVRIISTLMERSQEESLESESSQSEPEEE